MSTISIYVSFYRLVDGRYIEFINAVLNIRLFLMLRGRARPHTSMPDSDDWTSEVVDDNATLASSDIPLKRLAHANEYVY